MENEDAYEHDDGNEEDDATKEDGTEKQAGQEEEGEVRLTKDRIRQGVGNHNFFFTKLKKSF